MQIAIFFIVSYDAVSSVIGLTTIKQVPTSEVRFGREVECPLITFPM